MTDSQAPLLFSLETDRTFNEKVASHLGTTPARHEERHFGDGEHKIRPLESVRDRDVYLVQSLYGDQSLNINDKLMRLLFLAGALRDAGAARLTAVMPYLGYARKDRRSKPRDPLNTRYLAQLFEAMGVDRVAVMDVHNLAAFENSFRCLTEALRAENLFINHFTRTLSPENLCVASPDTGGVKRAESMREALERKIDRDVSNAFLQKKRSAGQVSGQDTVAGDVEGRDVIIYDDLIASGTTITRAAEALLERGARSVHAAATHGIFSGKSDEILATESLASLTITNTVPPFRLTAPVVLDKLTVLDAAPLIAEVVRQLHQGGSITELLAN